MEIAKDLYFGKEDMGWSYTKDHSKWAFPLD